MNLNRQKNIIYPRQCLILVFLIPNFLQYRSDLRIILEIWRMVQFLYTFILLLDYCIYKKLSNKLVNAVLLFFLISLIACMYNGISVNAILWDYLPLIGISIFISSKMKMNKIAFLRTSSTILTIYVLINWFVLIIFPSGIALGRIGQLIWFVGNKNTIIPYLILTCVLIVLESFLSNGKVGKKAYLRLIVLNMTGLFVDSANSMILVIISFIGIVVSALIGNNRFEKLITGKRIIIGVGVTFAFVVFFSQNSVFTEYITNLLGKDITFSGRSAIWIIAIEYIVKSPVLGNGPAIKFLPERWTIYMTHAHNLYLDIAAKYGITALGIAIYTIIKALIPARYDWKISKNTNNLMMKHSKIPALAYFLFALFLLGSVIEVYDYMFLFAFCTILYSYYICEY